MGGKGAKSRLFVFSHEAAVAENVGAEYGSELAFQYPPLADRDHPAIGLTLSIGLSWNFRRTVKWRKPK